MTYPTLSAEERAAAAHLQISFDGTHAWLTDLPSTLGRVLVILSDLERRMAAIEEKIAADAGGKRKGWGR